VQPSLICHSLCSLLQFESLSSKSSAQSFTVHTGGKQQWRSHAITLLLFVCATYMGVTLHAHPIRGELHMIQCNTNWRGCNNEHPFFFNELHQLHFLFVKDAPGMTCTSYHSTNLLRSESLSDKCAKLHTVATSNIRDHASRSLFAYANYYIQPFTC